MTAEVTAPKVLEQPLNLNLGVMSPILLLFRAIAMGKGSTEKLSKNHRCKVFEMGRVSYEGICSFTEEVPCRPTISILNILACPLYGKQTSLFVLVWLFEVRLVRESTR